MTELEYSEFLKSETDYEYEYKVLSLEHHGIKGQKWGVRRTPEQLGHKTKKKSIFSKVASKVKKKTAKTKKTKEEKKEESREELREKLLKSTDPAFIYKHRNLLDSKELQDRIDRIGKENKIKDLIPDPKKKQKAAMKAGEEYLKSLASMAESVGKVYDTYNKLSGNKQGGQNQNQNQNQNNNSDNRRRRNR